MLFYQCRKLFCAFAAAKATFKGPQDIQNASHCTSLRLRACREEKAEDYSIGKTSTRRKNGFYWMHDRSRATTSEYIDTCRCDGMTVNCC
jgi:hypothetical protein